MKATFALRAITLQLSMLASPNALGTISSQSAMGASIACAATRLRLAMWAAITCPALR
eukprot:CAMPEP_0183482950 /NCGR_PEP_ID=MMETSP0370-20130417/177535_1 /TAXON_ID=268820 /ORGANISM="Peridinium aciculiferum, Strain PAER-2" /LENGTH=57 /DNA_ID=CAMNT_0025676171 /DNA_START=42 /DNA_END=211 /DNA_ORIENTATION=+